MRGENQKLKLLYVKEFFEKLTDEDHTLTAVDIIGLLERLGIPCERKTVYDDIYTLRQYGMDIVKKREGNNCGYYLASRDFDLSQLKILVDTVQSSRFITVKKSRELIGRLETLCSKYQASELSKDVFVNRRIKNMNETIYYTVDAIRLALSEDRQLSFRYYKWNSHKKKTYHNKGEKYIVSPCAFVWDKENYYMIARDDNEGIIKNFRIDRMELVDVLDTPRCGGTEVKKFRAEPYTRSMFDMYSGDNTTVVLHCSEDMAAVMIDRFGHGIIMTPCPDGFEITVNVAVSTRFISWIMSFDDKVIIVSPQSVIDRYKAKAAADAAIYD